MILILSNKWDLTVDFVVRELRNRGKPFLRLNTEDLVNGNASIELPNLRINISSNGRCIYLNDVRVIWNRRPGRPWDDISHDARPSRAVQQFVNDQWHIWLESLQLLPEITWINDPAANDRMENKIRQLLHADRIGFKIPKTLISNDADAVREHFSETPMVAKALYSPLIEESDHDLFVFTNKIAMLTEDDDTSVRLSPLIFQERISPKTDYRVTVLGERVFAARIEYKAREEFIDWRTVDDDIAFIPCSLPTDVETRCINFVRDAGLCFGAIDLVECDDGFFFIEINPNGEWGWLQKPVGLPIAEGLCDLLINHDEMATTPV